MGTEATQLPGSPYPKKDLHFQHGRQYGWQGKFYFILSVPLIFVHFLSTHMYNVSIRNVQKLKALTICNISTLQSVTVHCFSHREAQIVIIIVRQHNRKDK